MKRKINLLGIFLWIVLAFGAGGANYTFFTCVINPYNADVVADQTQVSYFFSGALLLFGLLSAWMGLRADEENKKVYEAIQKDDFATFKIEVQKRLPLALWFIYALSTLLTIRALQLYHFASQTTTEIQFWWPFLITIVSLLIWDLDDPIGGVITIDAPPEWIKRLKGGVA